LEDIFLNLPLLVNIALIVIALYIVMRSAHYLVDGAVSIAHELNVSPLIIGATVVAMGTTSAENAVNLVIVLTGEDTSTVVGNILGSNLINFGIELGVSALVAGIIFVPRAVFEKDIPLYFGAAGLLTAIAADGVIQQSDGLLLLLIYCAAIALIIQYARAKHQESILLVETTEMEAISHPDAKALTRRQALTALLGGIFVLILSSRLLILNTTAIAIQLGIPEFIIGFVIIGPGTSIPEIASSIQAARRGHADLVLGTVFGSCLFNMLLGLGLPAVIQPLVVEDAGMIGFMFINVLNISLLALLLTDNSWLGKARTINRKIGTYLVIMYLGFISYQVSKAIGVGITDWFVFVIVIAVCITVGYVGWTRLARRPLISSDRAEPTKRILCATRGGDASKPTHEAAIALASEMNADLIFLYVFDQSVLRKYATPIVINVESQIKHMQRFLERTARKQASEAGIRSTVLVRVGSLREQLKIVGIEENIDTIILGNPYEATSLFKREALLAIANEIEEETGIPVQPLLGVEDGISQDVEDASESA